VLSPGQPFVYLLAYLAVLYIRPHEFVPFFMGWPVLPILLVLATVIWLSNQKKDFEAPQFWLIPVLAFLMALSVALSGWPGGALVVLGEFGPVVLLFFLIATTTDSLSRLRLIFLVLSVCAAVISLHGVDQLEAGIGWTGAELSQDTRITYLGFLNDPNDLAMALVMILPMLLYLAPMVGRLVRLGVYAAAGLVAYAVYLTNSRGSVLALGAMVFMYGILRFGLIKSLVVIPTILLPLIALGPSRMGEMSADEESAEHRIEAWYEGFQMLTSRPLFGVGKGQFADHAGLTAHNSYVLAFSELGLVGYFFWLSNIVIAWLMLRRIVRTTASPDDDPQAAARWQELRVAGQTLWFGYVGGLVSAFFLSRSYVVILYVHIALIVAVFQMARRERPDMAPMRWGDLWGKLLVGSLASVVVMWLITRVLLSFT